MSKNKKEVADSGATRMAENILVMDVEGTDGRERGEDQDFERKSALFALATSEVLIVNIWEHQVGLYQGANMGLLKTVFEVNLQLFLKDKQYVLPTPCVRFSAAQRIAVFLTACTQVEHEVSLILRHSRPHRHDATLEPAQYPAPRPDQDLGVHLQTSGARKLQNRRLLRLCLCRSPPQDPPAGQVCTGG